MKTKRPIIGVSPLYDSERDSLWLVPGYMGGIIAAGGAPVMMPLTDDSEALTEALSLCDGFLLTGGQDVSPRLYGEEKSPACGEVCPLRDRVDCEILEYALRENRAVLGICRGIQLINAYFGGTLYQDLPSEYGSETEHHMSPPYDKAVHDVLLSPPLSELLGSEKIGVNSYHHQAIKTLGEGLSELARSEDGLIEAVAVQSASFALATQWHPEFSYKTDEYSQRIFKAFVKAAK